MYVYILDKDFNPYEQITSLRTLIWDRRNSEPGMFELHCGIADFDAIRNGAYVFRTDREELGVIQEFDMEKDATGARQCYAKGYFSETMLADRVVTRTVNLSGTPEDIQRQLVNDFFIDTKKTYDDYDGRTFKRIALGEKSGEVQDVIKVQATGKTVGSVIYDIASEYGLNPRLKYDMDQNKLLFTVVTSHDRNAIFSDDYANIRSARYHKDMTDAPNVIYVAGSGEGKDRKIVRIDMRSDPSEYAREMYVDARDIQQYWQDSEGNQMYYTDEDYEKLLRSRGMQKLAEHKVLESFDVDANAAENLEYMVDYDIGDICTVRVAIQKNDKLEIQRKITSIREVYEKGEFSIAITFGEARSTKLENFIDKTVSVNSVVPASEAGGEDPRIGNMSGLNTDDKASVVGAVNEVNSKVGNLAGLKTTVKKDVVVAVNELYDKTGDLSALQTEDKTSIVGAINEVAAGGGSSSKIGDLGNLNTSDKSNLVAAINEVDKTADDAKSAAQSALDKCNEVVVVASLSGGAGATVTSGTQVADTYIQVRTLKIENKNFSFDKYDFTAAVCDMKLDQAVITKRKFRLRVGTVFIMGSMNADGKKSGDLYVPSSLSPVPIAVTIDADGKMGAEYYDYSFCDVVLCYPSNGRIVSDGKSKYAVYDLIPDFHNEGSPDTSMKRIPFKDYRNDASGGNIGLTEMVISEHILKDEIFGVRKYAVGDPETICLAFSGNGNSLKVKGFVLMDGNDFVSWLS